MMLIINSLLNLSSIYLASLLNLANLLNLTGGKKIESTQSGERYD